MSNDTQMFYNTHVVLDLFHKINFEKKEKKKIRTLLSCSAESALHFKINSSFLAFEMEEKFGTDGHPRLDPRSSDRAKL